MNQKEYEKKIKSEIIVNNRLVMTLARDVWRESIDHQPSDEEQFWRAFVEINPRLACLFFLSLWHLNAYPRESLIHVNITLIQDIIDGSSTES